jgi:hypothetical protein
MSRMNLHRRFKLYKLRISDKYGSLTRNKFLMKSVTTLKQNDEY